MQGLQGERTHFEQIWGLFVLPGWQRRLQVRGFTHDQLEGLMGLNSLNHSVQLMCIGWGHRDGPCLKSVACLLAVYRAMDCRSLGRSIAWQRDPILACSLGVTMRLWHFYLQRLADDVIFSCLQKCTEVSFQKHTLALVQTAGGLRIA